MTLGYIHPVVSSLVPPRTLLPSPCSRWGSVPGLGMLRAGVRGMLRAGARGAPYRQILRTGAAGTWGGLRARTGGPRTRLAGSQHHLVAAAATAGPEPRSPLGAGGGTQPGAERGPAASPGRAARAGRAAAAGAAVEEKRGGRVPRVCFPGRERPVFPCAAAEGRFEKASELAWMQRDPGGAGGSPRPGCRSWVFGMELRRKGGPGPAPAKGDVGGRELARGLVPPSPVHLSAVRARSAWGG